MDGGHGDERVSIMDDPISMSSPAAEPRLSRPSLVLPQPVPETPGVHLCVLASGSSGNCSVLTMRRGSFTRAVLIDLGLSPRRTWRMLAAAGIGPHQVDGAIVTHLDHDHIHPGWRTQMPGHARVWMHHRHAARLWSLERDTWEIAEFDGSLAVDHEASVRSVVMSHDEQGVAALRVDFTGELGSTTPGRTHASLGFATDVGRIDGRLIGLFGGGGPATAGPGSDPVDVLAIESNYCPRLQRASGRPEYLKQRIMGGSGHLSNQEAVSAILEIEPREHVVLLHLSRECNCPRIVASMHEGADYALTISSQHEPTRWIRIGAGPAPAPVARRASPVAVVSQPTLWSALDIGGSAA